jgi:hypothetical protein
MINILSSRSILLSHTRHICFFIVLLLFTWRLGGGGFDEKKNSLFFGEYRWFLPTDLKLGIFQVNRINKSR